MVVANQAIGDAYNTIANMGDKALESYQDALTELSNISDQHPYRAQLLLKMSNVLQRKGRLEEAEKILEELEKILYQEPDYPTDFFFCIEKTNFAISHGHLSQDYLNEANIWLHKMDSIYNCTQRSSTGFTWITPLPPTIEPWEIGTNNTGNKLWTSTPNCKQNTPVINAPLITAGLRWKKSISVKYKAWPWKPAESTRNCILL